uniref:Uncharacterized protein n=1 Tax=Salvator merianae TaxID=96440 RepID=A0A8D0DJW4_SALMN
MLLTLVAVTFLAHPVTRVLCDTDCSWLVAVNDYDRLGEGRYLFYHQHDIRKVADVFKELEDSAIDPNDKDAVNALVWNPLRCDCFSVSLWPPEPCDSEEVCRMCWYTPMPFMNGSAVMDVHVASNGLGLPVDKKRFSINVNGYVGTNQDVPFFKIGKKLTNLERFLGLRQPSRPLWYTHNQTPVLILGGVPQNKIVLMSDTGFEDFFPIEVSWPLTAAGLAPFRVLRPNFPLPSWTPFPQKAPSSSGRTNWFIILQGTIPSCTWKPLGLVREPKSP